MEAVVLTVSRAFLQFRQFCLSAGNCAMAMADDLTALQIDHVLGDVRGAVGNPFQTPGYPEKRKADCDMFRLPPDSLRDMGGITVVLFVNLRIASDDFLRQRNIVRGKRLDRVVEHPADCGGH